MAEILLFLIVIAIIIIMGGGKYWKFGPKGGVLRKVRTKEEEELEESWEEIEEEEKERKRRKERLATLFLQIESQISQEFAGERSVNKVISSPDCKLFPAPGEDIQEFLRMITVELSRKRTEYFIVGLLNDKNLPLYMLEVKGRSVWVDYDVEKILDKAIEVNTTNIVCIHNHPASSGSGLNLEPSEMDICSGYSFYIRCNRRGLNFLGDFIVNKGDYQEFLMPLIREAQNDITGGDKQASREFQVVEEVEQKRKAEGEREIQVVKDAPVFLVDEIPLSFFVQPESLQRKDYYKKWTFSEIADYVKEDIRAIHTLIIQGKTPIVKRVDSSSKASYLWLARKKDFDVWVQKYKASHEK